MKFRISFLVVIVSIFSVATSAYGQGVISQKIQQVKESYPDLLNDEIKDITFSYLHMILPSQVTIAVIDSGIDRSHPDLPALYC